jgi:hypothetical protein
VGEDVALGEQVLQSAQECDQIEKGSQLDAVAGPWR